MMTVSTTSETLLYIFASSKESTSPLLAELSDEVTRCLLIGQSDELPLAIHTGPGCLIVTASEATQLDFSSLKKSLPDQISVALHGPVSAEVLLQYLRAGYSSYAIEHEEFLEIVRRELECSRRRWENILIQKELATELSYLTNREQETYELVVQGLETKAIAASLGVAVGTAEKHKLSMLRKLSCRTATELLASLLRRVARDDLHPLIYPTEDRAFQHSATPSADTSKRRPLVLNNRPQAPSTSNAPSLMNR